MLGHPSGDATFVTGEQIHRIRPPPLNVRSSAEACVHDSCSGCGGEVEAIDQGVVAVVLDVLVVSEAGFLGDPDRRTVARGDDRNHVLLAVLARHLHRRSGGFTGIAFALLNREHVVAQLERFPVNGLPGQAALTDELPVKGLEDPQAVAITRVVALVPVNPGATFPAGALLR